MEKETLKDISLFVLRIVIGVIFLAHGAQKLFGMFGGTGLEGTEKMVEGLGFSAPHIFALVWSIVEFAGGLFLMLGILSRLSAAAIMVIVAVTIWKINLYNGLFIQNGGFEYQLTVIAACVPLMLMGGGRWSVWDA